MFWSWRRGCHGGIHMIGYVTIGALDSEKSGAFYDAVLGAIGHARAFADGGWIGYGPKDSKTQDVYICPPFEGKPGFRPPEKQSWYGAYLRDPTGNKIAVYFTPS